MISLDRQRSGSSLSVSSNGVHPSPAGPYWQPSDVRLSKPASDSSALTKVAAPASGCERTADDSVLPMVWPGVSAEVDRR